MMTETSSFRCLFGKSCKNMIYKICILLLVIVPFTKCQVFNCSDYGVAPGRTVKQSLLCDCQDGAYNCTKYHRNKCVNLTEMCSHCGEEASKDYCVQKSGTGCPAGYVSCNGSNYCVNERYMCTRHICSQDEYQCPINSYYQCIPKQNVCERCNSEDVCVRKDPPGSNCTGDTVDCGDQCFSFLKACYTCEKNQYPCGPDSSTSCVKDPCSDFCTQGLCSPMPDAGCDPALYLFCEDGLESQCLPKEFVCDNCGNGNIRCPAWSPRKCVNLTEVNGLCSRFCNSSGHSPMCSFTAAECNGFGKTLCQELSSSTGKTVCINLDFVCEHTADKVYVCDPGKKHLWLNKTQIQVSCDKYCGQPDTMNFCEDIQNQTCPHEDHAPCASGQYPNKCISIPFACDDCDKNSLGCPKPYPRCINEMQIMDQCNKYCAAGNCTSKEATGCKRDEVECTGKYSNQCLKNDLACECDFHCNFYYKDSCITKERVSEFCQFCNVSGYCEKKNSTGHCPQSAFPCPNGEDCVTQLTVCGGKLIPSHSVFQCGSGYKYADVPIGSSCAKCQNNEACVKYSPRDIEPCLNDEFMCVKNETCIPKCLTCGCFQNQTDCTQPQQKFCANNESIIKLCLEETIFNIRNATVVPKSQFMTAVVGPAVVLATILSAVSATGVLSLLLQPFLTL